MQPPTIDDEVRVYSVKSIAPLFDGFVADIVFIEA